MLMKEIYLAGGCFWGAEHYLKQIGGVMPLKNFCKAEEYHQDYLDKNPAGYCHLPSALFEYARKANAKTK